jgi:hypothetical protein
MANQWPKARAAALANSHHKVAFCCHLLFGLEVPATLLARADKVINEAKPPTTAMTWRKN